MASYRETIRMQERRNDDLSYDGETIKSVDTQFAASRFVPTL